MTKFSQIILSCLLIAIFSSIAHGQVDHSVPIKKGKGKMIIIRSTGATAGTKSDRKVPTTRTLSNPGQGWGYNNYSGYTLTSSMYENMAAPKIKNTRKFAGAKSDRKVRTKRTRILPGQGWSFSIDNQSATSSKYMGIMDSYINQYLTAQRKRMNNGPASDKVSSSSEIKNSRNAQKRKNIEWVRSGREIQKTPDGLKKKVKKAKFDKDEANIWNY